MAGLHPQRFLQNNLNLGDPALHQFYEKRSNLTRIIVLNIENILSHYPPIFHKSRPCGIYVGLAGISLLFYHLHQLDPTLEVAGRKVAIYCEYYVKSALPAVFRSTSSDTGFLGSPVGTLALRIVVSQNVSNDPTRAKGLLDYLFSRYHPLAINDSSNELLYGRVGYLYALQFIRKNCEGTELAQRVTDNRVREVFDLILHDGRTYAATFKQQHGIPEEKAPPLMWKWYEDEYLGAIHGVVGIIAVLLQCHLLAELHLDDLLRTLEFVMGLAYPSGNFPSCMSALEKDELVQFCHGAPGVIPAFTLAYELYPSERTRRLLSAAETAGECVWEQGLLKKGVGLCHGIAGNAFAFLALHRCLTLSSTNSTPSNKNLWRARAFARFAADWEREPREDLQEPEKSYSLFEGLAGAIWLWADLLWDLDKGKAGLRWNEKGMGRFPCFTDLA